MHDNKTTISRLNRIKGQIEGIIKMVEEDKYCVDVSNQIIATTSALKSLNRHILSNHLRSCVKDSFDGKKINTEEKIEEIVTIIDKIGK